MIKHILAGVLTLIALLAFYYVFSVDYSVKSIQRAQNIIEKSKMVIKIEKNQKVNSAKKDRSKNYNQTDEKVKALVRKAGNIGTFKVSKLYKSKCSSCHGINGEGGVGTKLIGLSYQTISNSIKDFKSGDKKNYVMYGLLQNLNDTDLDTLAKEIATFAQKDKEMK